MNEFVPKHPNIAPEKCISLLMLQKLVFNDLLISNHRKMSWYDTSWKNPVQPQTAMTSSPFMAYLRFS